MVEPTSGTTHSPWMATAQTPALRPLDGELETDVCVIGAGIAGMTTAYLLVREGRRVTVLDHGAIGGGETSRTTAHLSNALDDRYFEMVRIHGREGARLAASSHTYAIDMIEEIVEREQIACGFTRLDGWLFLAEEHDATLLHRELRAAHDAGLRTVELEPHLPVPTLGRGPCLRFPRQGQFHPLEYLAGLAAVIRKEGGSFYGAHVTDVDVPKRAGGHLTVHTQTGQTVRAPAVVVATNSPITTRFAIHTKQAPYRTYAVALRVPKGSVPLGLYWDTLDPYHYVRLQADEGSPEHDLLIVGGEDHKTGQASDVRERFARLRHWARAYFPMVDEPAFEWSGQVMETIDGLAFIGGSPTNEPGIYLATGDSGMGMTHGTIAGIILSDLIGGRPNPWAAIYDPKRRSVGAALEWAKENFNVARRYGDLVRSANDVTDPAQIAPGQGAVLRRGARHLAAYRDPAGLLHVRSAICSHLGCVVQFNSAERTWDCPCHGSRFDTDGNALNGPASAPLAPVDDE
ncbi:FAD-dependent oxidoreductase [Myxococcota bacterium]|nr:FAD-dependent oxidoreductase [Myxococcota bacterium]